MIVQRFVRDAVMLGALMCAIRPVGAQSTPPAQREGAVRQGQVAGSDRPNRRKRPPHITPRTGREITSLDGDWRTLVEASGEASKPEWDSAIPKGARTVTVPALLNRQGVGSGEMTCWLWREFDAPARWEAPGETVRLKFEGAADHVEVWLNGTRLGEHQGGAVPFAFNATPALHLGASNLLAVRLQGDPATGAGLWQSVLLLAHDEAYISDSFPQGDSAGNLNVPIRFTNLSAHEGDAALEARLVAVAAPKRELHRATQNLRLTSGSNETLLVTAVRGKLLQPWSPSAPTLVLLQLVFRQDQDVLDTVDTRFGFRTVGVQDGAVTINGAPVKLSVQAPTLFQPLYVLATPEETARARRLIQGLKAQGVSALYLAAPPSALLNLTDEEGMLVVETTRPDEPDAARIEELRGLILRDRAHPSIIAWDLRGLDDETDRVLRSLDPTRLLICGPASAPRVWQPDANAQQAVPLPDGLLPTH